MKAWRPALTSPAGQATVIGVVVPVVPAPELAGCELHASVVAATRPTSMTRLLIRHLHRFPSSGSSANGGGVGRGDYFFDGAAFICWPQQISE